MERNKTIPIKSETRQGCPFSPYLSNIVIQDLARAIRQLKESQGIQIEKTEIKVSLLADDMLVHISEPTIYTGE